MPNDRPAKTASARKALLKFGLYSIVAYGLGIAAAIGLLLVVFSSRAVAPTGDCVPPGTLEVIELRTGRESYRAEVAVLADQQAQGLSGRMCLADGQAMLFSYAKPGDYCYWMKDMNFAIDMVWLDGDKRITTIKSDVKPETYPTAFCPDSLSQYVLEVPSGTASRQGWATGQLFEF